MRTAPDEMSMMTKARLLRKAWAAAGKANGPVASDDAPKDLPTVAPASFPQLQPQFRVERELAAGGSTFNVSVALRLRGVLDRAALRAAIRAVVERHEPLRTTFRLHGTELQQVVNPTPELPLPCTDLGALEPERQQAAIVEVLTEEDAYRFDLAEGPVLRARLLRCAGEDHVLVLNVHHVAIDGLSTPVLMDDLATAYNASMSGNEPDWPALPIRYIDFAARERAALTPAALAELLGNWRERLAGLPDRPLRPELPVPAELSIDGEVLLLPLAPESVAAARELARGEYASLFMVLLTVLAVTLADATGQEDLPIGAFTAGRNRADTYRLIGMLAQAIVLRTDVSGQPTFRELLRRVAASAKTDYAHLELPFTLLLKELGCEPEGNRIALPQVVLDVTDEEEAPAPTPFTGLTVQGLPPVINTARFDLVVAVRFEPGFAAVLMRYHKDLFERATIADLLDRFQRNFDRLVGTPDQPARAATVPAGS